MIENKSLIMFEAYQNQDFLEEEFKKASQNEAFKKEEPEKVIKEFFSLEEEDFEEKPSAPQPKEPQKEEEKSFETPSFKEPFKEAVFLIEVEKIKPNPYQPRTVIKDDSLFELAQSIRKFGILQPLVVQKIEVPKENGVDVYYELIAGHRRLEAAKMIGLERVPAIVRKLPQKKEQLEIAVIENLQREDLSPIEVARAFARLSDEFGMTQREIALRIGKSRQAIANALRLLQLPEEAQKALEEKKISETHARILLLLENPEDQKFLLEKIINDNLTTRQAQILAQKLIKKEAQQTLSAFEKKPKKIETSFKEVSPFLKEIEKHLEENCGWNVSVVPKGFEGCRIIFEFSSKEELKDFLRRLFEDKF